MQNKKIYVLVICLFVVALMVFLLTLRVNMTGNVVLDKKEIPTTLIIGERAGFNLTQGILGFGRVPYGSYSTRDLDLVNNYSFPVLAIINVKGDIADFLLYEKEIKLDPGEIKSISIDTVVFKNEPFGNYNGIVSIEFKRYID